MLGYVGMGEAEANVGGGGGVVQNCVRNRGDNDVGQGARQSIDIGKRCYG